MVEFKRIIKHKKKSTKNDFISINNKNSIEENGYNLTSKKNIYDLDYLDWFFDQGWLRVKKTDF